MLDIVEIIQRRLTDYDNVRLKHRTVHDKNER